MMVFNEIFRKIGRTYVLTLHCPILWLISRNDWRLEFPTIFKYSKYQGYMHLELKLLGFGFQYIRSY